MKITDVKTFVVGNPPPSFGGTWFLFVKLTTDSGVVGYGEAYNSTISPQVMRKVVEDVAERWLIGEDPASHRTVLSPRLFRRLYPASGCDDHGRGIGA